MKIRTIIACILALGRIAMAQTPAVLNNGAGFFIASGTQLQVNGDFTNGAGGQLKNNGVIITSGNVTNNAPMNAADAGELILMGSAPQSFSGDMTYATNVTVSNPAGVLLLAPLQISGQINFVSGILTNNNPANAVMFTSTATISTIARPTDASHVNGFVGKQGVGSFVFPVGDDETYQPIGVNLSANDQGMLARYVAGDAGTGPFSSTGSSTTPLVARNTQEYWTLTPVTTATGSATVSWDAYNNTGISDIADLVVAHFSNGNWQNEGKNSTDGNIAAGSVTSNVISNWSPFTLGSIDPASPLPVRLISFTASKTETTAELNWKIANAINFSHFEVERSADAIHFEQIGRIDFLNAPASQDYHFSDKASLAPFGTRYYRLRMVDADGTAALSKMLRVNFNEGDLHFTAYPNPSRDKLTLKVDGNASATIDILVSSSDGRQVIKRKAELIQGSTVIDTTSLPSGVYLLSTIIAGRTNVIKFAKN